MALSVTRLKKLKEFQEKFDLELSDFELLNNVFCHKSYVNEHKHHELDDNERLEFFGDAVLKLAISEYLYSKYPNKQEGYLTKARAMIVSDSTLAKIAISHNMGEYLLLSKNDMTNGGKKRKSTNANLLEALFGACYLDKGLEYAKKVIYRFLAPAIDEAINNCGKHDYKSLLQEKVQSLGWGLPHYKVLKEEGPEHEKLFHLQVTVGAGWKKYKEKGSGHTKKEAEQAAAKSILKQDIFSTAKTTVG